MVNLTVIYRWILIYFSTRKSVGQSLYALVIGVLFAYAIVVRFAIPLVPFTGPDSIGYLGVAFNFLNGGQFIGIAERSFPYPGFLTILVNTSKDVSVVSLAQHSLGILGGVFYLRIMGLVRSYFLDLSPHEIFLYKFLSMAGLFLLLLSPWQLMIEHSSHPEALTMPLFAIYLYSTLRLYEAKLKPEIFLNNLKWSTCFFITNCFIFMLQPRFIIASAMGAVIFYYFQLVGDSKLTRKLALACVPSLVLVLLINIPLIKNYSYTQAVDCNRSANLFFYNLNTIAPIIQSDIDNPTFNQFNKEMLNKVITDFASAKASENKRFSSGFIGTIGYNSDYTLRTYYSILTNFDGNFVNAGTFYKYYLKKAIFTNPFGLIKKVLIEMKYFYSESQIFIEDEGWYAGLSWKNSYEVAKTWKAHFSTKPEVYNFYVNSLDSVKDFKINKLPTANLTENISAVINKTYTFQCICFLVILSISYFLKSRFLSFGIFTLFVMLFGVFVNLAISIAATTVVQRYIYDQLSWNLLFILYSLFFIILVLKNDVKRITSMLFNNNFQQ